MANGVAAVLPLLLSLPSVATYQVAPVLDTGVVTLPDCQIFHGTTRPCAVVMPPKPALACCAWFMVTVQVLALPAQAPPQPLKLLPLAGSAVRVTTVAALKLAAQLPLQRMPAGLELTVPAPLTLTLKV